MMVVKVSKDFRFLEVFSVNVLSFYKSWIECIFLILKKIKKRFQLIFDLYKKEVNNNAKKMRRNV